MVYTVSPHHPFVYWSKNMFSQENIVSSQAYQPSWSCLLNCHKLTLPYLTRLVVMWTLVNFQSSMGPLYIFTSSVSLNVSWFILTQVVSNDKEYKDYIIQHPCTCSSIPSHDRSLASYTEEALCFAPSQNCLLDSALYSFRLVSQLRNSFFKKRTRLSLYIQSCQGLMQHIALIRYSIPYLDNSLCFFNSLWCVIKQQLTVNWAGPCSKARPPATSSRLGLCLLLCLFQNLKMSIMLTF